MQYSIVAVLALAGAAFANPNPVPQQVTITTSTTRVVTITSCAPTVTLCPAVVQTQTIPVAVTYPVGLYPTGGLLVATGTGGYNFPAPTGGLYRGPSFTGAGNQVKAAGALAGVGAVAALLL